MRCRTLANTWILLAKRLGTFNDGSTVHNEFRILLSKYITPCPNGKCLATKRNQTLLSDQTCGCLTKCFIKILSTSKFYQTRSLFDHCLIAKQCLIVLGRQTFPVWTGLYKTYAFVRMIDVFFSGSVKLSPNKDLKEEVIFARASVAIIFQKVVHP